MGAGASFAQETRVAFGAEPADPSQPVEVTADSLDVNQADGSAEFTGEVLVIQGAMRMTADRVFVIYDREASRIAQLEATGNVVLVNGPDAAESDSAVYSIDNGLIVMTGNVLLTQGPSVLSSQRMTVDLTTGTAQMAGRVKTILNPGGGD
nr:lipopolysaccharide transport periplasmic protein LptA [Antarcticimicrobium luteum]